MGIKPEDPLAQIDGKVPPSLAGLDIVHELLVRYWSAVDGTLPRVPDGRWRALFDSAIAEIATNIIRHGYPPGSSQAPLTVSLRCFPDRMEATLSDWGIQFELPQSIRPADMRATLDSSDLDQGWGLPIVQAAVDHVEYEHLPSGLNRWHLEKRLPS